MGALLGGAHPPVSAMTISEINWKNVRRQLTTYKWYRLGTDLPYTQIARLQAGLMDGMDDVEVRTRNNRFDQHGRRYCDVYLRNRE